MRWLNLVFALVLVVFAGCKRTTIYDGRGVVRQIAADRRAITIAHEAIPGYMMAMTMSFPVRDTNDLGGLAPGDVVTFRLAVRDTDDWVDHLRRTGQTVPPGPPPSPADVEELKPGDEMPDFEFTTETGEHGRLADFRGVALAFTFFFTSCPLPDYCPRMNKNLAEAREFIAKGASRPKNWEFLSLSFDSGFDTPEILANYAGLYRGVDTNHWLFAVIGTNSLAMIAPRLDLMVMRSGSSISHNLRTVVLDTHGRIYRQFDGNEWTPQQLAEALRKAAQVK